MSSNRGGAARHAGRKRLQAEWQKAYNAASAAHAQAQAHESDPGSVLPYELQVAQKMVELICAEQILLNGKSSLRDELARGLLQDSIEEVDQASIEEASRYRKRYPELDEYVRRNYPSDSLVAARLLPVLLLWARLTDVGARPAVFFLVPADILTMLALTDFGDVRIGDLHRPFPAYVVLPERGVVQLARHSYAAGSRMRPVTALLYHPENLGYVVDCNKPRRAITRVARMCAITDMPFGTSPEGRLHYELKAAVVHRMQPDERSLEESFAAADHGIALGLALRVATGERFAPTSASAMAFGYALGDSLAVAGEEFHGVEARRALARLAINIQLYLQLVAVGSEHKVRWARRSRAGVSSDFYHPPERRASGQRTLVFDPRAQAAAGERDVLPGEGVGHKLRHQSVTRGHWRRQPYGPGRVSTRLLWIKPFIRGLGLPLASGSRRYRVR